MQTEIVVETENLSFDFSDGIHLWGNTIEVGFSRVNGSGKLVLCTMAPGGRVMVWNNNDVIFDTNVADYVMAVDKPSHPVPNYRFLCGWYEAELTRLLGNDKANEVMAKGHVMEKLNETSGKANL